MDVGNMGTKQLNAKTLNVQIVERIIVVSAGIAKNAIGLVTRLVCVGNVRNAVSMDIQVSIATRFQGRYIVKTATRLAILQMSAGNVINAVDAATRLIGVISVRNAVIMVIGPKHVRKSVKCAVK